MLALSEYIATYNLQQSSPMQLEAVKAEIKLREQMEFNRKLEAMQAAFEQQLKSSKTVHDRNVKEQENDRRQEMTRQLEELAVKTIISYIHITVHYNNK